METPAFPPSSSALACVFSRRPVPRRQRVGARLLVVFVVLVVLVLGAGEAKGAAEAGGQALSVVVLQLRALRELLDLGAGRRLPGAVARQDVPQPVQEPRSHGTLGGVRDSGSWGGAEDPARVGENKGRGPGWEREGRPGGLAPDRWGPASLGTQLAAPSPHPRRSGLLTSPEGPRALPTSLSLPVASLPPDSSGTLGGGPLPRGPGAASGALQRPGRLGRAPQLGALLLSLPAAAPPPAPPAPGSRPGIPGPSLQERLGNPG